MAQVLLAFNILLLGVLSISQAWAADDKRVSASYIESPIIIDGELDELVWNQVEPARNFIQK